MIYNYHKGVSIKNRGRDLHFDLCLPINGSFGFQNILGPRSLGLHLLPSKWTTTVGLGSSHVLGLIASGQCTADPTPIHSVLVLVTFL